MSARRCLPDSRRAAFKVGKGPAVVARKTDSGAEGYDRCTENCALHFHCHHHVMKMWPISPIFSTGCDVRRWHPGPGRCLPPAD